MRGGGQKSLATSPVTSTNVGISLQNVLTFILISFVALMNNFKAIASAGPK